jgi:hypothetical protein
MSQIDIDVPVCLQHLLGSLLGHFVEFFLENVLHATIWRTQKNDGGHVTPWWLYARMSLAAPRRSVLQFGETTYKAVNPVPHLWVRGKAAWIQEGAALLRVFVRQAVRRQMASLPPVPLPPMPTRAPPRWTPLELTVLGDFHGASYGAEYLDLRAGDHLEGRAPPAELDPQGWSFAWHQEAGRAGWYPGDFARCTTTL